MLSLKVILSVVRFRMLREVAIRIELMVGITIVSVVCEVVLVEIII